MPASEPWIRDANRLTPHGWLGSSLPVLVVSGLVCLGAANIASRSAWREVEDGVLWAARAEGVVAADIAAGTSAAAVGLQRGDLLIAIDDRPIDDPSDVVAVLHAAGRDSTLRYTVLRLGSRDVVDVRVAPVPGRAGALYFVLAAVAIFTLLVGGAVRLRRPRDPATLHFLWLSAAFFGVCSRSRSAAGSTAWTGCSTGPTSSPSWRCRRSSSTSRWSFPSAAGRAAAFDRAVSVVTYAPAVILGLARVVAVARSSDRRRAVRARQRRAGSARVPVPGRLLHRRSAGADPRARARPCLHVRRQLKWIAWGTALGAGPFAFGYALPYARGVEPSLPRQLSAIPLSLIPLAYASAIVRYRLRDIEVIVKRALVFATIVAVVVAMFVGLLEVVQRMFPAQVNGQNWVIALLGTLVALLLAPPVKDFVQTTLDRAFYRDRYDYRRALVGFARDLNSDLDPGSLATAAGVAGGRDARRGSHGDPDGARRRRPFRRDARHGLDGQSPVLKRTSAVGRAAGRWAAGGARRPDRGRPVRAGGHRFWRDAGLLYFVPCVSQTGTTAVLALGRKHANEPLSSEDMALLAAVAGQMATALENARLYRQLHVKALELDRLRAFNENILESLDDGLLVVDLDDRVVRWNSALERPYGVRAGGGGPAARRPVRRAVRRGGAGGAPRLADRRGAVARAADCAARSADAARHRQRARSCRCARRTATTSSPRAPWSSSQDVTARVQFEEQLQISEKMASIGLLAAGVAHEVNTPLTGISSFTQMLLQGADPDDPRTRLLEKIERQTFRAAKIVNGLLNLSRPASAASSDRAVVDLNVVMADVLGLLEHQFATHSVKLRKELSERAGDGARASSTSCSRCSSTCSSTPRTPCRRAAGCRCARPSSPSASWWSWPTPAAAFRTSTWPASTTRSSRPRR